MSTKMKHVCTQSQSTTGLIFLRRSSESRTELCTKWKNLSTARNRLRVIIIERNGVADSASGPVRLQGWLSYITHH